MTGSTLADYDLVELLAEALRRDESWFNAIFDITQEALVPNSHETYTKLLQGVAAIGEADGFPWLTFRAMVPQRFDEVHAEIVRGANL